MGAVGQMLKLVRAGHPCLRFITTEEHEAREAVAEVAMAVDRPVVAWSAIQGLHDGLIIDSKTASETENLAVALLLMARADKPSIFVLYDAAGFFASDERALRAWRELLHRCAINRSTVVLIDHRESAPTIVGQLSVHVELPLPDEEQLEKVIRDTARRQHRERGIEVELTRSSLRALVTNLRGLTRRQAERLINEAILDDMKLTAADLPTILEGKRRLIESEGVLEHVDASVTLDQIGGMARLKRWLACRAPSASGDDADSGLTPPRGMLLLGVQGAGKSLCAKAVAAAWQRPLMRMDVGRLYDRYIGESERRLREAFTQAGMMAPIVLWIDEIEKAFASAASQSSDGGLSRRMFGALLTWMQEHREPVFLVATANDIEALPPELLRKGRFDEIFFVDLPGSEAREQILRIHLAKRKRPAERFDLPALVAASDGFSGAEIEQAIVSGLHEARAARRDLSQTDVLTALQTSPPLSVTMAERMTELRDWAKGRCVPAD